MRDRAERIGLNEALFREVNERVKGINDGFGGRLEEAEFVCECGDGYLVVEKRAGIPAAIAERTDPRS